jgi:PAS domain S-box-containing protein
MTVPIRVFYLDDYPLDRAQVRDVLQQEPGKYELSEAGSATEFEKLLGTKEFDLILSDFNILGFTGFQALERVKKVAPGTPVIILTGTGSEEMAVEAIKRGASDYIVKSPLNIRLLPHNIQHILENKRAEDERRKMEAKYRLLVEQAADGIFLADGNGCILDVNPSGCVMVGYTCQELLTMNIRELDSMGEVFQNPANMEDYQKGKPIRTERELVRKDGSLLPVEITARIIPDGRIQGIVRDISQRKRMEELLLQNEMIFSSFLEHSPVYVFFKDKETRSLRLSKNYEQMLAMPVSQALGKTMDDLFPSDLAKSMVADDKRILNEGKPVSVIEELNGRTYETTKFPIFKDGKPDMLAGFTVDVTERKQVEQALREKEAFNQAIIQHSPIGISVRSREGGLLSANPAWRIIWGIPEEDLQEMLQHQPAELKFDERDGYLSPHHEALRRVYEQGGSLYLPKLKTLQPRPGGADWVSQHFYAIQDEHGRVERVVILTEDMTARERAETGLRESEEKFRGLFESAQDAINMANEEDEILDANQRAYEMLGYTRQEFLKLKITDLLAPEVRSQAKGVTKAENEKYGNNVFEGINVRKDGTRLPVEVSVSKISTSQGDRYISIVRDITERKRVENELKVQIDILERFQDVTVGRELRMIELKKEINALLVKAGEQAKYRILEV